MPILCQKTFVSIALLFGFPADEQHSQQISKVSSPGKLYSPLMEVIVRFAGSGLINRDFNEFNVLIRRSTGETVVIDFPQMVSTSHTNAGRCATLQLVLSAGTDGGGLYSRMDGAGCSKGVVGHGAYNHWVTVDARVDRVEFVSVGTLKEMCLSKPSFLVPPNSVVPSDSSSLTYRGQK